MDGGGPGRPGVTRPVPDDPTPAEIINALANVEGVRVVARTSAFSFKGKNLDVRKIGADLNVATLEGSVRREGNQLRVFAQLIGVADGYHLWSKRYDRELKGVFSVEDELARAIVLALKPKLVQERPDPSSHGEVEPDLGSDPLRSALPEGAPADEPGLETGQPSPSAYHPAKQDGSRVEILFLLGGLVFVAFGVGVVLSEARARRGAWAQQGEVIGFSTGQQADSGMPSYHPVVEYGGPDGRKRYLESLVGSSSPIGAVGDAVTVLVRQEDPERAVLKSSLTYGVGTALALMGLVPCIVFFAVFRATPFFLVSATGVVTWAAYQFRRATVAKPMTLETWRKYKDQAFRPRVFTDANKAGIPWADPEAVRAATARQQKANRFILPILFLAGVGLLFLGVHLHQKTGEFLARAVRAPGVVVEMATNHSSDGADTYAPVVEFEHQGGKYTFKDSMASNPPSYRRGEAVGVLYDPDRPRDARIDRGRWNKAVPILIGGFGALLCLLGAWGLSRRAHRGRLTSP